MHIIQISRYFERITNVRYYYYYYYYYSMRDQAELLGIITKTMEWAAPEHVLQTLFKSSTTTTVSVDGVVN